MIEEKYEWYTSENSSEEKPAEVDKTSSKVYIYYRKDFVEVPAEGSEEDFDFRPAHWQWQECKFSHEEWEKYKRAHPWKNLD